MNKGRTRRYVHYQTDKRVPKVLKADKNKTWEKVGIHPRKDQLGVKRWFAMATIVGKTGWTLPGEQSGAGATHEGMTRRKKLKKTAKNNVKGKKDVCETSNARKRNQVRIGQN